MFSNKSVVTKKSSSAHLTDFAAVQEFVTTESECSPL